MVKRLYIAACYCNYNTVVVRYLLKKGTDINFVDKYGNTALIASVIIMK